MKLSENWLREWVNPAIDTESLVSQLTMAGLEVEAVEPAGVDLDKVIVGEVMSVESHPDADKLSLCQVSDGSATKPVVCGASNVREGLKVAFAQPGATLPGRKIKKVKLRGVESHGMLCSAVELNLGEDSDGILELPADAPVGVSIVEYLALDDNIIDIDLTPNRGDCLSLAGVAREVSALNGIDLSKHVSHVAGSISDDFPVELLQPEGCPHYVGRIIKGINASARTPMWMQEKLRRSGLRPISPVVDVTNFVMMEIGQPMHGFDFDKLEGGIRVRLATAGEKLTLLDQTEFECRADSLVIADFKKAVALAGIMGGLDSSVQADTKNVFLEAAFFAPLPMAGKARSYGMHTDSSHRFERGVDPGLQVIAMHRATELLLDIVGGKAGPVIDVTNAEFMPEVPRVNLRYTRINRLLGIQVSRDEVVNMLESLNMQLEDCEEGWMVVPPSYRFDINIEADLIEEIGRMVGYNNIPGTRELAHANMESCSETQRSTSEIRDVMVGQGFYEAVTYSFVSPELQSILDPGQASLALSNPISPDMSVMRTRLLPGLVQALQYNLKRQQSRVRLFETGLCFIPGENELQQRPHIAAVITGSRDNEGWFSQAQQVDFYDIKGNFESILKPSQQSSFRFAKSTNPVLHPGQGADVLYQDKLVGFVGALHPGVIARLQLTQPVFVFELELTSLLHSKLPSFGELSKYPSIRRDIALTVDANIDVQELINCIYSIKSEILQEVIVFDVYTGMEVRNNRKSVALGLILQDFSRTLVDEDVENLVNKVLDQLKKQYNALLR
ncbi:MAG: phenylalanine--tRNA ligase subunit beta [Gammaproteobacteria bacterium]|nr:phenylalanine--tRNA ligase subunit beta [Gammaproteobacteria bacterium]